MLPEITPEELSTSLDAVAMEVLDEARDELPPVDAMSLARKLGITVAIDARQRGRARYVRLSGARGRSPRATVLLRPEPRSERLQWALAHELGEHLSYRVFTALGVDPSQADPRDRETIANLLAGRILLPGPWFVSEAAAFGWDLARLKVRYATASHELIARRMLELSPPVTITIFDQGRLHWRRSNVCGRVPPLSAAETRCWRAVHETGRSQRVPCQTRWIRGWPVHEAGWKREILRTEVELDCDA